MAFIIALSFSSFASEAEEIEAAEKAEEVVSVVFTPSSNDTTESIEVLSGDEVVTTYEIITNNKTQNARDTIQRALRYARNNASENDIYTVRLPKGTYYFYSSLDIYSNTVFDLNGSEILRAGNCASLIRFGEKNDVSYGYDGYKNITIKNGVFDGNQTGSTSLIRFAHADNIKFDNLTFTNTKGVMHLLTFAASNNVSVTDCTFSDMTITEDILDSLDGYSQAEIECIIRKALSLAQRENTNTLNENHIKRAIGFIIKQDSEEIDNMTRIAINECNDMELLSKEVIDKYINNK
jgi:hypothetical protein